MVIVLNKDEKRALISFITIYTFSSLSLLAIIAILYFNKEIQGQKSACKQNLQETILTVQLNLLNAKLNHKDFIFCPMDYQLKVGLFDLDGNTIDTNLIFKDVNLKQMMSAKKKRVQRVKKLEEPIFNISYIVAEDSNMPLNIKKLKYFIYIIILLSCLFIAFVGYLLSRLLLKPVNEKMKHIDKFIKDSAHEINTPVTALLMSVSVLRKKGFKEEKLLKHIAISSKQISEIYNSLCEVAFSDIKNLDKSIKFDLRKEVLKSIAFYKEIADAKGIKIVNDLTPLYIQMDRQSANRLINNLLSNAVKYSYNAKTVTITIKENKLSIKDEGIGISKKDQQEILKRYKRGTDQIGGFGIGLDIVNSICAHYNITLTINSKVGKGSLFTLDFSKTRAN